MSDINVSIGGDSVEVSIGDNNVNSQVVDQTIQSQQDSTVVTSQVQDVSVEVDTGVQVTAKDVHRIVKFTGDGSTTNFSTQNDEVMRTDSWLVLVQGVIQGDDDIDYNVDGDKKGITFKTAPKNGRQGELRYVVD